MMVQIPPDRHDYAPEIDGHGHVNRGFVYVSDAGPVFIELTEEGVRKHLHLIPEILEYLTNAVDETHARHEKTLELWKECDERR